MSCVHHALSGRRLHGRRVGALFSGLGEAASGPLATTAATRVALPCNGRWTRAENSMKRSSSGREFKTVRIRVTGVASPMGTTAPGASSTPPGSRRIQALREIRPPDLEPVRRSGKRRDRQLVEYRPAPAGAPRWQPRRTSRAFGRRPAEAALPSATAVPARSA